MSIFTDLEKDAASVDGFANENGLIPTRRNGPKPSYQYLVDRWNAEIAATIIELNKSRGFRVVGTFADGFTYELFNDVGIDADGNSWIYVGAGAPNKVVAAGTVPSVGEGYQQVTFNSASNLQMDNGESVQKFTAQSRQAIEAVYKAQGYNNVFFFKDGFTYTESNDVGVYEDGTAWTYADTGALPVTIAAGTVPSEVNGYDELKLSKDSAYIFKSISEMTSSDVRFNIGDVISVKKEGRLAIDFIVTDEETPYTLLKSKYAKITNSLYLKSTVNNLLSGFKRKPSIRNGIESVFAAATSNPYSSYISPKNYGADSGLVIGGSTTSNISVSVVGELVVAAPDTGSTGVWDFSIVIELLGGAEYENLTVLARKFESTNSGSAPIGSGIPLVRSGNTYTLTGQSFTSSTNSVIGIQVVTTNDTSELFNVSDFSITDNNANNYSEQSLNMLNKSVISFTWSQAIMSRHVTDVDGFEMRTIGARSGYVPSAIYSSPNADDDTGSLVARGLMEGAPLYLHRANELQQTYYYNGISMPVLIMEAGTYSNTESLRAPLGFRYSHSSVWNRGDSIYAGCPFGEAVIESGGNYGGGAIYGLDQGVANVKVNLLNIRMGESVTRPFRGASVDFYAYNCHSEYADSSINVASGDGWEFDYCDFTLEECSATGAINDGFNHHGYGHGVLIDCNGFDNEDDGFSPHDFCTYEVWGGAYTGNGKGNITPAFGAKGFCYGVKSANATGLSTRVTGDNWGGFIALSRIIDDSETIMILIDCESDSDGFNINASGDQSYVHALRTTSKNADNGGLCATSWTGGGEGVIYSSNTSLSGNNQDFIGGSDDIIIIP